ncbi:formate dehydrogenase subunit alpha [Bdellovibrionota bacterium FG-2]
MEIFVNGSTCQVPKGSEDEKLLSVLKKIGIEVPHLCSDPRFAPSSSCRLCEVEVEGCARPVCSCATPVVAGMKIKTHTPELEMFRKTALGFLARHFPRPDLANPSGRPTGVFEGYLEQYGVEPGAEDPTWEPIRDSTHPYIHVDMSRCVHCYRCVHICNDLQGQFVWKTQSRGSALTVLPDSGTTLKESSCVSCGACVDTCPSGALADARVIELGAPEAWTKTTCPYCGVGCELNVGTRGGTLVSVRPVLDSPSSKGHLCVKGRYSTAYVGAPDRLSLPLVRQKNGSLKEVSWDEALDEAAKQLRNARDDHGPQAVGVLGSARGTNEEAYLTHKFARSVLGTNNVDCCARVCHAPSAAGAKIAFGTGAATNSFDDIELTHLFLLCGTNATENHPVVGARIKQRQLQGIPSIVIDPRRTELAAYASIHLQLRPGTNIPLFNGLARVISDEGLADQEFIRNRTEGWDEYVQGLREWDLKRVSDLTGVPGELIRKAARLYATTKPAMSLHGLGMTEHIQGTDSVVALANLSLLTGNVGKRGAGVNPLRGQNNVQGAAVMGCEPASLTGSQKFELARETHEKIWGVTLPTVPGFTLMEMLDEAHAGRMKSLLMIGYDVYFSNPNAHWTKEAMKRVDSLIVVDPFLTKTAEAFATVVLPAVTSFEKEGTFMNGERRIQRVRQALAPFGEAKNDSQIVSALALRFGAGKGFDFADASQVWEEIRMLWPAVFGITYGRLEKRGLQWPCPSLESDGVEVLHTESFSGFKKAKLRKIPYRPTEQKTSSDFPMTLVTGRSLHHFNVATMTGRTRNRELVADDLLEIHPDDAASLNFQDGEKVHVESAFGEFVSTVWVTSKVRRGELFTTFHNWNAFVNYAIGTGRDPVTGTPEYKVTAVRVRSVGAS